MQILCDDNDFVVLVKQPGTESEQISYQDVFGENTSGRLFCVHRLDKETGGVMVFAKNEKTASVLSACFSNHRIRKTYLALCEGILSPEAGCMEDLLFHDRKTNKTYVVKRERKDVKKAVLSYETLNVLPVETVLPGNISHDAVHSDVLNPELMGQGSAHSLTLCKVILETGRTHQIRIQFASRKHPLAGDRRYGSKINFPGLGLWACELSMPHPVTGEKLVFCSDPLWGVQRSWTVEKK